jgi:hypothetical protein
VKIADVCDRTIDPYVVTLFQTFLAAKFWRNSMRDPESHFPSTGVKGRPRLRLEGANVVKASFLYFVCILYSENVFATRIIKFISVVNAPLFSWTSDEQSCPATILMYILAVVNPTWLQPHIIVLLSSVEIYV